MDALVSRDGACVPRRVISRWTLAGALALFGVAGVVAEDEARPLPSLPAKIEDQLRIESLQREIEIVKLRQQLKQLQGLQDSELERKIKQLGDMLALLEVNSEVRTLIKDAPELDAQYWQVLDMDEAPPSLACACMDAARVVWLGRGGQAGQAVIRLAGGEYDTSVGETIGNSGCRLAEADADSATLACRDARRTLGLQLLSRPLRQR